MAKNLAMVHTVDPASVIQKQIGDLKDYPLFANWVLVGVYERPEMTKSGIILPDQTRSEDKYQGKAALVLKKGPSAFKDDDNYKFHGMSADVGDWVAIFVTDGRQIIINGQLCRMVEDYHIRLKLPAPDVVY